MYTGLPTWNLASEVIPPLPVELEGCPFLLSGQRGHGRALWRRGPVKPAPKP